MRLRVGRGGRKMLDRRDIGLRTEFTKRQKLNPSPDNSKAMNMGEEEEDEGEEKLERQRQIEEQWKYDQDDMPAVGPQGQDEQDRILVDEYQTKLVGFFLVLVYILTSATLKIPATYHDSPRRHQPGGIGNR